MARIGLAKVDFLLASSAFVAFFAFTNELVEAVFASASVLTRISGAFVNVRLTSWAVETSGTLAFVASHNIDTSATIFAGIVEALVNICLAITTSISRLTFTLIAVDAVNAFPINAGIVDAVIIVMLAIFTPRAWQAAAFVSVGAVDTNSSILTRIGQTLVDGSVAQKAAVARMTLALESVKSANTIPMDARIIFKLAFVVVDLAKMTRISRGTVASKRIVVVATTAAIHARIFISAIGDASLASFSSEAKRTSTSEAVDKISANAAVLAWVGAALINVCLAMSSRESGHANAAEPSTFVNTRPFVLARIRFAFIDVHLAASALKTR